MKKVEMVSVQG